MSLPSFRVTSLRRREWHPNLLAAWSFDEGTGTIARDSSGSAQTLTVGASATWVTGHTGRAIANTNGTSAAANRTWNVSSPITIMGWARPTDLTLGTIRPLFGIWSGSDSSSGSQCVIWAQRSDFSTANVLQGNVRVDGGLVAVNHTALTLNTWVHLALTYDNSTIRLFRNGVEVGTVPNTGTITPGSFFFHIAPNPDGYAEVDDVRVFNTALNAAQIAGFMGDPVAP